MNSLSRFQIILLVVFGALAVSGVLIFALAVGGNGNNGVGPVRIWGTFDEVAINAVLRQSAETMPELSQVSYEQHDPATYDSELTNALASGTGPDLFIIRQDFSVKDSGKIIPIPFTSGSPEQFEAAFIEAANPFVSKNLGAIIAVPFLVDPLVMYWNRDLFATAGYAKPPSFWDETVPMSTYVNSGSQMVNQNSITVRDQTNIVKKSSIAFGEYRNIDNAKDILSALILQAGGSITTIDSANHLIPALASKAGDTSQATESALRFYTGFADPSKNDYSWNRSLPESRAAFAAGDLGMYVGYASEEPLIRRMNPNLNFAPTLLPQVRGGQRDLTFGHVYGFATARTARSVNSAIAVAQILASTALSKSFSVAIGIPSARRDVLSQKTSGESEIFNRSAVISRAWIDPDPDKTNTAFQGMIENTTSGSASVSEAVQRADQEIARILGL